MAVDVYCEGNVSNMVITLFLIEHEGFCDAAVREPSNNLQEMQPEDSVEMILPFTFSTPCVFVVSVRVSTILFYHFCVTIQQP